MTSHGDSLVFEVNSMVKWGSNHGDLRNIPSMMMSLPGDVIMGISYCNITVGVRASSTGQ